MMTFVNRWIKLFTSFVKYLALGALNLYRYFLSPFMGGQCRFEPSCSLYAEQAIKHHSPVFAFYLVCRRLVRCQPWGGQGYEPIPRPLGKELENDQ